MSQLLHNIMEPWKSSQYQHGLPQPILQSKSLPGSPHCGGHCVSLSFSLSLSISLSLSLSLFLFPFLWHLKAEVPVDPKCVCCLSPASFTSLTQPLFGQLGIIQELSGIPKQLYFLKSIAGTNGRCTAVQMGGVLRYKQDAYCGVSLSSKLRSQQDTALQMGRVLRYKVELYCSTFQTSCTGGGLLNSVQSWLVRHDSSTLQWHALFHGCGIATCTLDGVSCPSTSS